VEKILQIENLTKNFGNLRALSSIQFDLNKGEIVGIIGPNGAGKSTLLNIISGVTPLDKGRIIFNGVDITNKRTFERCRLGIVKTSQIVQPFSKLTVFENIYLAAIYGGREKSKEASTKAEEIICFLNLKHLKNEYGGNLTLHEKRRLDFGRALATQPSILLLDENMGGLIPDEIDEALRFIKDINQSGVSIIIVEHVMSVVRGVSDRVVVLNYGEKIADAATEEVFNDKNVLKAYFGE